MDQEPRDRDAVGGREEGFAFLAVEVECQSVGPGNVDRAPAGGEDGVHEGFGDGLRGMEREISVIVCH